MHNAACQNGCTYSRKINQVYPRECIRCGKSEKEAYSVIALALDKQKPGDKPFHTVHVLGQEKAKLIAVMPGEEPVSMTTWKDRVILAQGNRLYELKRDVHDEYALIELNIQMQPEKQNES